MRLSGRPIVGFDLDMTLADLRPGTAAALHVMNRKLGARVDVEAVVGDLGRPFREQLLEWIEPDRLEKAVRVFGLAFLKNGVGQTTALPGAREALDAVRRSGRTPVVVTGRSTLTARACLRSCGLWQDGADLAGSVTGAAKAPELSARAVEAFIGDHVLDMAGAMAAGVPGVGVLTGSCSEAELRAAGATAVVDGVTDVAQWLAAVQAGER